MAGSDPSYLRYAGRRLGQGVVVLALAYLVVFFLLFLLPGNPISARLSDPENGLGPEQVDQLLAYYGMDRPVWVQLADTLGRLLQGDLGYSLVSVQPVGTRISEALPSTLQLAAVTLVLASLLALVVSAVAVIAPWAGLRRLAAAVPAASLSVPSFVVGLLVLQVFSYGLGWFNTLQTDGWIGALPGAAVLAIPVAAPLARILIETGQQVQREPYVTFARSKGLNGTQVLLAHLTRPSALPGVTMLGLAVAELITGSVIVEAIFNRNGLGSVIERAVTSRDSPVLLGVILLAAAIIVVVNLVVDLLYPLLDPRLRVHRSRSGSTAVDSDPIPDPAQRTEVPA